MKYEIKFFRIFLDALNQFLKQRRVRKQQNSKKLCASEPHQEDYHNYVISDR